MDVDIFISPEMRVTEFICGSRVNSFPLLIKKKGVWRALDEISVSGVRRASISIRRWYGWHRLYLPSELEQGITLYLNHYHNEPDNNFDCYAFARVVAGLPLHDKSYLRAFWKIERISPNRVVGYRVIFMVNESCHTFAHAAIHIGQGYFLSVQGAGGRLSVSRLSDLQMQYSDYPDLLAVTPKASNEF